MPAYGATYAVAGGVAGPIAAAGGVAVAAGGTATVPVTVTNTGSLPWLVASQVNLAYHLWTAAGATVVWDGVRTVLPANVQPGQTVTLAATVRAPLGASAGTYTLGFDMVQEGITWFSGQGVPGGIVTLQVQ